MYSGSPFEVDSKSIMATWRILGTGDVQRSQVLRVAGRNATPARVRTASPQARALVLRRLGGAEGRTGFGRECFFDGSSTIRMRLAASAGRWCGSMERQHSMA